MIRPRALETEAPAGAWSCRGCDTWDMLCAAEAGDVEAMRRLISRDPNLVRAEYWYTQPIHLAVREGHRAAVELLLAEGADPRATGLGDGLLTTASDRGHHDVESALVAAREMVTPASPAAAAGSAGSALSIATGKGDAVLVQRLLESGVDPNAPEGADAPRGRALHIAATRGDQAVVELLLGWGADPNGTIDSAGSATFAARTAELRQILVEAGGELDAYDLVWLGEEEAALERVSSDAREADAGCGGVLAAACKLGKGDLVEQLLAAGARVPPALTECRSYLLEDAGMLKMLLVSGMDPNLPNWQRATPLHDLCGLDSRRRPRPQRSDCAGILVEFGADLEAEDDEYRSTPLGWAARSGLDDMVEWLLEAGANSGVSPGSPSWATPLSWARRRGHAQCEALLLEAGAVR